MPAKPGDVCTIVDGIGYWLPSPEMVRADEAEREIFVGLVLAGWPLEDAAERAVAARATYFDVMTGGETE